MHLANLVVEDAARGRFRVHRSAMTSTEILGLERECIFNRTWLYVGHDSEVPAPGDYRRRMVAGRPLFMVRGRDGKVRVFFNTCRHRGALVCRRDEGNAETFQCFYHGWAYNDRGELTGVPDVAAYAEGLDFSEHGLLQPAHVDSYRGLHFVNFSADAAPLADYLADAREIIDLTMDSAEMLGGWAVVHGTAKFDIRANWKMLVENSVDNYHFRTVHQTYLEYRGERRELGGRAKTDRWNAGRGLALRNGHLAMLTLAQGRTIANASPRWSRDAIEEVGRIRAELVRRYGEARGLDMADISRFVIVFPNLAIHDTQSGFKVRQCWPVAPDLMEVSQWELVPRHEREDLRAYRMEGALTFQGPGGFGTPDDIEALESCQTGFRAREVEWSDASRGMRREARDDDELTARGFWRQWHALIQGRVAAERTGDPPRAEPAAQASGAK